MAGSSYTPARGDLQNWTRDEEKINCDMTIPPQAMQEYLNPAAAPLKKITARQVHLASRHLMAKSHTTHCNDQTHHDMMLNLQDIVDNASITQQAVQQAVS